jgi:excinuclease ABC subunit A
VTPTPSRARPVEVPPPPFPPRPGAPAERDAGHPAHLDHARCIRVRGAREHNLKNIDADIPRDQLVVITGLSGSGKSSLAFDTIFAEGQRKYMESLSAYARQFLDQLKKPDVDDIEGLPPTIAIEQRSGVASPRSTVATSTEIYDYLRLLYARCGQPVCWAPTKLKKDGTVLERCGRPIQATAATQIVDAVMAIAPGTRLMILAPVVRGKKGFHADVLESAQKAGWGRLRVNGTLVEIRDALKAGEGGENPLKLGRYERHDIAIVVDRATVSPESRQRIAESVESALRLADGSVVVSVEHAGGPEHAAGADARATFIDRVYSEKFSCPDHPECALEELSPRLFSFNSPHGACPTCHGLGLIMEFDEDLIIPDQDRTLAGGAVAPWRVPPPMGKFYRKRLRHFCAAFGVNANVPVRALSDKDRRILIFGSTPEDEKKHAEKFEGVVAGLRKWYERTESAFMKEWLGQYMREAECPTCLGDRLRIETLHVLVRSTHAPDPERAASRLVIGGEPGSGDTGVPPASKGGTGVPPVRPKAGDPSPSTPLNIAQLARLTISDARAFAQGLELSREHRIVAEPILKEVLARLGFLESVGLEYLSLDRKTGTLSGGEAQRIRLATQVGSKLVGACYVLDEPTIGLHQRDNARLIATLRHLADIGNSVLVVEHDEDMIRSADHVVDMGPGPGVHGGRLVGQGTVAQLEAVSESLTGQYLSGRMRIDVPKRRRPASEKNAVVVKGARHNNLKNIDAAFPLNALVCVTGVSGSGKSTLVNDILLLAAKKHLGSQPGIPGAQAAYAARLKPGAHARITGLAKVDRVIEVDQSPIGRTPRSNPATYTGIFDDIRRIFTQTKEAKIRGYKPGRFSFNVSSAKGGGRCEACEGQGLKKIEMHFLPDVYVDCEVCEGRRYNKETLEVHYRSKSIADVLDLTVDQAVEFFENHPVILRYVTCLRDVGLGYIKLGQPSTTLSGGEAQRIKLATELGKASAGSGSGEVAKGQSGEVEDEDGNSGEAHSATVPLRHSATSTSHTLYILDEPTTGLHFEDVRKLVGVLNRLADAGNTLVVIEHNLDVIKCADWIIDLGPEGGDKGGTVIASGTPEQVAKAPKSYTGHYLKEMLKAK